MKEFRRQVTAILLLPDDAVRPPTIIFILRKFSLDNTCSHGVFVQTAVAYLDKRYLLRTFAVSYKRASVRTANSKVLHGQTMICPSIRVVNMINELHK